jgi:hypothetical protein
MPLLFSFDRLFAISQPAFGLKPLKFILKQGRTLSIPVSILKKNEKRIVFHTFELLALH